MLCSKPPPEFQTVVLKVNMRTEECSKKVSKALHNMKDVEEYEVEFDEQKVTVTGRVDPHELVKKLKRKTGRHTELWTGRSLAATSSRKSFRFGDSFRNSFKRVTTIFSDEDPNSCSIM